MLQPGTQLHGRYLIEKALQEGGMSVVYRARDTSVDIVVAIKEMKDPFVEDDERARAVQEFHKEAKLLASLHHPGLPRVSHFFESLDHYYVVMDFIEGETLDYAAAPFNNQVPENVCLSWTWQLCEVLDYLHHQKPPIIFRDLKPGNIMVTADGRIKLIDFGIAKIFEPENATHTLIRGAGTPGFAPPEQYGQLGRSHTDARTDVYALGATLYCLMQGVIPVEATTRFMHNEPLVPLTTATPPFRDLILRCLELEPQHRPQTIQAVMDILRPLVFTEHAAPVVGLPTQRPSQPTTDRKPAAPPTRQPPPAAPVGVSARPTTMDPVGQAPKDAVPAPLHTDPRLKHVSFYASRRVDSSASAAWKQWGVVLGILALGVLAGAQLIVPAAPVASSSASPSPAPATMTPATGSPGLLTVSPSGLALSQALVQIYADPPGTRFKLDGGDKPMIIGTGGFTVPLPPGLHHFTVTADGYLKQEVTVTAVIGQVTPLRVTLSPEAVIRVVSTPPAMVIKVNGEKRGVTPLRIKSLRPGTYTIALSRPGYKPYSKRLKLDEGETVVLDAAVEKLATPTPTPPPAPMPQPTPRWTVPTHRWPPPAIPQHTPQGPAATPWQ